MTPTEVPLRRPAPWKIALALGLVYVCWGTTYLALKWGVRDEQWPPLLFGGVRVFLAGVIVFAWQLLRGERLALEPSDRFPVVVGGLLLFVCANGLLNIAGTTLDSSFLAVLGATAPLFIALFEILWPGGDRLAPIGWLGLVMGLAGVALLCVPSFHGDSELPIDIGVLCALGSAACWALGSLMGRHRRVSCTHLTAACYQMLIGGSCLALVGLAIGEGGRLPSEITWKSPVAFAWLLILGSLLGFISFNWLLAHVSVAKIGTHAYVNPAIAVMIGLAIGEPATPWLFAGVCVVLMGVALFVPECVHEIHRWQRVKISLWY